MDGERDSFGKKAFFFLLKTLGAFVVVLFWLPYQLYCIALFIYLLPEEWRRARAYHAASKEVIFCRISERRVKLTTAVGLIHARRQKDGQVESRGRWPSHLARWRDIIREPQTTFWKFGTLEEIKSISIEALREDLARSALGVIPKEHLFVWAIDERSNTFVAFNPFTDEVYRGLPSEALSPVFFGDRPPLSDEHFVYAVSVRIKESSSES